MRALALVGGWAHPAAQTAPALTEAFGALGIAVECTESLDDAAARLDAGFDLFVVHACRFQMLDARYSDEQRAAHASRTPPAFRAAVTQYLAARRPLLGLHTAALCFDDWPKWNELLGATWDWSASNHPPPGRFQVDPTVDRIVDGVASFAVVDELYRFVQPIVDAMIVATAVDSGGLRHPIVWRHNEDGTRVAYSALGHDHRSLSNPDHRLLLGRIVDWLVNR